MNWAYRSIAALLIALLLYSASYAEQKKPDRWFSRDKFEHFAVSAFYSAGAATIAHKHFELDKNQSLVIGFGFTVSLGIAKEAADFKSKKGTASIKDFIWDVAGALTGTLLAGMAL